MALAAKRVSGTPPLSPRQELLKIQKEIFRHNQELINNSTWVRERAFAQYERDYRRQVRDYEALSNIDTLIAEASRARVVYLGDYHTNPQSQRTALRLLKLLVAAGRPIVLAVELVQARFQKTLDALLAGQIDEPAFLKAIQLKKYWYFDLWQNFKPIFDFALYHHLPVYGLEDNLARSPSLAERDVRAARVIERTLRRHPEAVVFVLAGDLHMAPHHLPRVVEARFKGEKGEPASVIVYQNSESIYWRLAEEGLEDKVEVVRIDPRSFCIINTPPVICQQSYLNWLEHEEGEIDWADAKTSFMELVGRIAGFMDLDIGKAGEAVEVFTSGDLSFLARLKDDPEVTGKEFLSIKRQIGASESYYFAKKKWVYLGNLSLNHAGEEASHFIRHAVAGDEFPRRIVDAFYANVIHEALGFFGSKIINHKRKCSHEAQFQGLLQFVENSRSRKGRELEYEIARLVLEHKRLEGKGRLLSHQKIFTRRERVFFGVTHALGYMLGDRIYYAMVQEKVSKEEIRSLFQDTMKNEGTAAELYLTWIRKVKGAKLPRRV